MWDTDRGSLDRDPTYDRAVGPMQFIPGTWRRVGVDANGDGVKDPQDIGDAATAAAVYPVLGTGERHGRQHADRRDPALRRLDLYRRSLPAQPHGVSRPDAAATEDHGAGGASSEGPTPQPASTGAGTSTTGSGGGSAGAGGSAGSGSLATSQSPSRTEVCYLNLLGVRVCDPR